ncbi:MAG: ATPase, T2SS/T4P/T4SS family [Proteobacteria bacterium]|nr:ATPase, T2SS/T4P/T4SS family [Pseudomonadota bacterium]MDA1301615.1 ATPase, T2SS/T4P/T4SS family [Pseudomonadota bacterium]
MADKPVEQTAQRPMLIGDLLIARNLVSAADVDRALQAQARVGGRLGALLMRGGAISEDVLLRCLGEQLGLPVLGQDMQEPAVGELIQFTTDRGLHREWLLDQQVLVWEAEDRLWYTATDLMSVSTRESLSQKLGSHRLSPCLAPAQTISRLLGYLKPDSQGGENLQMLLEMAEEAPTVELVNNVLAQAADSNASDVHIEPEPDGFKIRLRIDGVLHARHHLPRERFNAVVSRIKLISNIDIAERRLPQGRPQKRMQQR